MNTPVLKAASPLDPVDTEIRQFITQMDKNYEEHTPNTKISPVLRREIAEKVRKKFRMGGPVMANTETITLSEDGVRIRIYTPENDAKLGQKQPVLLYIHGGGWVMFSIDTHDRLMREYADASGYTVIGLDYSLSPEHIFPRALDDIDAAYAWIFENAEKYGLDVDHIVIGGDSAGGNLSLCSTLRRRDQELRSPIGMLLNYTAVDTQTRPSHDLYDGPEYVLGSDEMSAFWHNYLGAPNTQDPYARPLLADLSGLPPMHSCIAECDILRDENLVLVEQLKSAGVQVSSIVYDGATHSFLEAMSMSSLARKAIADASDWLRNIVS